MRGREPPAPIRITAAVGDQGPEEHAANIGVRLVPIGASLVPASGHCSRHVPLFPVSSDRDQLSSAFGEANEINRLIGAGEGIRTPDPNLGKVVLYP
jgi:hypothetical protein